MDMHLKASKRPVYSGGVECNPGPKCQTIHPMGEGNNSKGSLSQQDEHEVERLRQRVSQLETQALADHATIEEKLEKMDENINALKEGTVCFNNMKVLVLRNEELEKELKKKDKEVQDLAEKLKEAGRQIEEQKESEKQLNNTIEELTINNNQLKDQLQNKTQQAAAQKKKEAEIPQLAGCNEVRDQVQQLSNSKVWDPLCRSLERYIPHDSPAYRQLQSIKYSESYPVYWVGYNGCKELIEVLVGCGGSVGMTDSYGYTILHGTAYSGNVELSRWLLQHGADVEARNNEGVTPLMCAAMSGKLQTVQLLVQAGASTTAKNNAGHTALDIARRDSRNEVMQYLQNSPH